MNKTIKEQWIKSLNSNDYIQGTGYLKQTEGDETRYCCLGVLCDLYSDEQAKEESLQWKVEGEEEDGTTYFVLEDDIEGALPQKVAQWAGLNSGSPVVEGTALTRLNDSGRASFKQIADLIEAHL